MLKLIDNNGESFILNPEHILRGWSNKLTLTSGGEYTYDKRSWNTIVAIAKKMRSFIVFYSRTDKTDVIINDSGLKRY